MHAWVSHHKQWTSYLSKCCLWCKVYQCYVLALESKFTTIKYLQYILSIALGGFYNSTLLLTVKTYASLSLVDNNGIHCAHQVSDFARACGSYRISTTFEQLQCICVMQENVYVQNKARRTPKLKSFLSSTRTSHSSNHPIGSHFDELEETHVLQFFCTSKSFRVNYSLASLSY